MSPKVVGERIRQARLKAGMTQVQLARAINTSERNVVRWESGRNAPRVEHLVAIAKATDHDTSFFLEDDESDDEEADPPMSLDEFLERRVRRIMEETKA